MRALSTGVRENGGRAQRRTGQGQPNAPVPLDLIAMLRPLAERAARRRMEFAAGSPHSVQELVDQPGKLVFRRF